MPHRDALKPRPAPGRPTIAGLLPTDQTPGGKSYGQRVIEYVKNGIDIVNAAQTAGVDMATLGDWNRDGQINYSRYLAGADWATEFTPQQQDAVWFHRELEVALAEHKGRLALTAEQLAIGGTVKTTKRVKSIGGKPAEEHVTTETMLPDAEMLRWKLERLQPDVYGRAARLDILVHDMTDSPEQMDIVQQRVEAIRRQKELREGAIDATATEDVEA